MDTRVRHLYIPKDPLSIYLALELRLAASSSPLEFSLCITTAKGRKGFGC